ncbi:MAG: UDP-N-acetylglucosamine 4-epimerase [Candidatus Anoxychlamydiales bacterium]|nr:UDP-N-acetylglucosamine 4-epimerase [Candidatus Anoxychlamydiales bacterium]NGX41326.1 UDP-N-acetylglucosamine 4-epimerase [Candidatus Anoxychlamydiales bacterium]HEU64533.1 SDR family NAD(P)-dependent oxidoreductase [Chlamydiota bacterium]
MKNVFVTGAAGFIGFHLCRHLKKRDDFVIGLDNFNPYYDVNLKNLRKKILKDDSIEVIKADINDKEILEKIIKKNKITHVVHLAAQAGVRFCFDNPEAYVNSNIVGFVNLLEVLKDFKDIKLIFASSSSVYGLNDKIPFSPNDKTDNPTNLYGATKKANETLAFSYHHIYKIPMIGLRYFTVYGPFGRPDMAYFKFTKNIIEGKEIEIYNQGEMKRDFTYIDDIIEGTISAIDKTQSFEIFNLGNNTPINLLDFIKIIEKKVGKKAIKKFKPFQKGEMLSTFADIKTSKEFLKYNPKTNIEDGIEKFINWYTKTY